MDALVEAARGGDSSALAALYREFQPALLGFLTGLAGGEAEDLAAETWIDMAQALVRFEGNGTEFRRLLLTIGRRRAIDHGRRRSRRRTEPVDLSRWLLQSREDDPSTVIGNVDAARSAFRRIAELLPSPQAEVVILRVVAGLSVGEVAQIVGRSPAAVSVLQNRGLRRLATMLESPAQGARERTPW
jgi:RNA polymerase sigma-70 factor, ECF subfamily